MKIRFVGILFSMIVFSIQLSMSQTVPIDSVISVVLTRINRNLPLPSDKELTPQELGTNFYVQDISTRSRITDHGYGIYEFGLFGDDLDKWIMWYDATGYKIYDQNLDVNMLGEILDFCKRNKLSEHQSFRYIESLYKVSIILENIGEKEIIR